MSDEHKPKSQDYVGLASCAVGGLATVSICLSTFGGQRPSPKVEALLRPVVLLEEACGTPAALLAAVGLVAIGVWAFLGTKPLRFGRPLYTLLGATLAVAFLSGGVGAELGGWLGDFVRVNDGLAGRLSALFVGGVVALATWRPELLVPRVELPDIADLGRGRRSPAPGLAVEDDADAVGLEETELLAAPPKKHPAAPPPFVDVRLEGGIPEGAQALPGAGTSPVSASFRASVVEPSAAPVDATKSGASAPEGDRDGVRPLVDDVPEEPAWAMSVASWEAPARTADVEEEVVEEMRTAWNADPEEYARTLQELERSTEDAENPFAVDVSEAYEDANDPLASAARARTRWVALSARTSELEARDEATEDERDEEFGAAALVDEVLEDEEAAEYEDDEAVEDDDVEYEEDEDAEEEAEYEDDDEVEDDDAEYEEDEDAEEEAEYEDDEEVEDDDVEYEEDEDAEEEAEYEDDDEVEDDDAEYEEDEDAEEEAEYEDDEEVEDDDAEYEEDEDAEEEAEYEDDDELEDEDVEYEEEEDEDEQAALDEEPSEEDEGTEADDEPSEPIEPAVTSDLASSPEPEPVLPASAGLQADASSEAALEDSVAPYEPAPLPAPGKAVTPELFPEPGEPGQDRAAPAESPQRGRKKASRREPQREVVLEPQPAPVAEVAPEAAAEATGVGDELIHAAGLLILDENRVAVSMLQRRFELDFDQACAVLDELQERGLIGPYKGGRTRDILLGREDWVALAHG